MCTYHWMRTESCKILTYIFNFSETHILSHFNISENRKSPTVTCEVLLAHCLYSLSIREPSKCHKPLKGDLVKKHECCLLPGNFVNFLSDEESASKLAECMLTT